MEAIRHDAVALLLLAPALLIILTVWIRWAR
jgi:hypothetical protein